MKRDVASPMVISSNIAAAVAAFCGRDEGKAIAWPWRRGRKLTILGQLKAAFNIVVTRRQRVSMVRRE